VKILLDENFPLGLLHALRANGFSADHIITLGWRGVSDAEISDRTKGEEVLFITQDLEFLVGQASGFAIVLVSRVRQSRPIADRIATWHRSIRDLLGTPRTERLFELSDDGVLLLAQSSP
jgi:hypothetical protein